jgi:hypothetical protein
VYIIEANPRASRTVPFVAKAIGHPLAAYASLLMSGKTLPELGFTDEPMLNHVAVKEAVLPFEKFQGKLGHPPVSLFCNLHVSSMRHVSHSILWIVCSPTVTSAPGTCY